MQESMFINIYDYADERYPFQFFIGGRGTGKTYGALKGQVIDHQGKGKFILMRRTGDELDILLDSSKSEDGGNPFKAINRDQHCNIGMKAINKKIAGIYHRETEEDKIIYSGAPIGYGVALSTVANIRGSDFSDCTDCIYDEFIPEKHVRRMRNECDALLNAYETFNRNREFDGLPAMRMWLLSNANDIYNPIFVGLGIVSQVERMLRRGKTDLYIEDRGLAIHLLAPSSDFIQKKEATAISRLTQGTSFHDMAYANDFAYNDFTNIGYRKLAGYLPVCSIDAATVYKRKGSEEIYVSYSPARVPCFNSGIESDCIRFRQEFGCRLYPYYVNGSMYWESYELKEIILQNIL